MSESSLSPAPAGPEGPADLADPLSASTPPAVLPQPQGRVYGPWWQQAGAWIVIGAVVVVCATALVLGIGLSGRSSNQAAPVVFETVTVTPTKQDSAASAASTEPAATATTLEPTATAATTPAAQATWDDRELPPVSAACPAPPDAAPTPEEGKPLGATDMGGIALGCDGIPGHPVPDGAVQVDVVSDYICPFCLKLEQAQGYNLGVAMREGRIQLIVHPLGYLDSYSTTNYSSRAANAAATVAALAPEYFWDFNQTLWRHQPAEGGPGLSDEDLVALALEAGVPAAVADQFGDGLYAAWVAESTAGIAASEQFQGTPWVLMKVPGEDQYYQWYWPNDDLDQAVANVAAGQAPAGS